MTLVMSLVWMTISSGFLSLTIVIEHVDNDNRGKKSNRNTGYKKILIITRY